jgi:hypothetical protein
MSAALWSRHNAAAREVDTLAEQQRSLSAVR